MRIDASNGRCGGISMRVVRVVLVASWPHHSLTGWEKVISCREHLQGKDSGYHFGLFPIYKDHITMHKLKNIK